MAAKVIITKKVYNQIDEIVDWYNERSLSAAKTLLKSYTLLFLKLPEILSCIM